MAQGRTRSFGLGVFVMLMLMALLVTALTATGVYLAVNSQPQPLEEGTVLEVVLDGTYTEAPVENPLAELGVGPAGSNSLWSLRQALRRAADDASVAGVLVTIRNPELGMAQLEELAAEFERYREVSGKSVYAVIETDLIGDRNYYAATSATKIWATPEAWWLVNGLHADITFWRGTLDKLKIEPDVIMFKEYKSAGEPIANTEMSDAMREAYEAALGDVRDQWLDDVSSRRSFDRDKLAALVDEGTLTGARALSEGLVDELGYRDQAVETLKTEAGVDEYKKISVGKYLLRPTVDEPSDSRIAVVFGEGPIVSAPSDNNPFVTGSTLYGPTVAANLRKAAEDDKVKAIVFRVNSPGGSAVGSDFVWREIERAQAEGKPVVVSMSTVAGSGGYWVAMGSDAIVAHPSTITGSIGVVFTKLNVRGFYEWMGANVESVSFSENGNLLSPYASFTEEQRAQVTATIEATYNSFVSKVAEGRASSFDDIEPLAHGRIWSGEDALENGLIDELGGLDTALARAASEAGLSLDETDVVAYPKPKPFIERLLEGELGGVQARQPTVSDLEAWLIEMSTPKVQVLMPDVRIY